MFLGKRDKDVKELKAICQKPSAPLTTGLIIATYSLSDESIDAFIAKLNCLEEKT